MRETFKESRWKLINYIPKMFKDCFYREKKKLFKSTCLRISSYQGLHNFTHYKFAIKKGLLLRIQNKLCLTINCEFEIFTQIESEHKQWKFKKNMFV